jgi:murein L,D-transpeptidase YcbB/YkuD
MSVRRTIGVVGAMLAGTVSASGSSAPPADPGTIRALLVEVGMLPRGASDAAANAALRRFQARVGLPADGVAGPLTCRALARHAREARELRDLGFAA